MTVKLGHTPLSCWYRGTWTVEGGQNSDQSSACWFTGRGQRWNIKEKLPVLHLFTFLSSLNPSLPRPPLPSEFLSNSFSFSLEPLSSNGRPQTRRNKIHHGNVCYLLGPTCSQIWLGDEPGGEIHGRDNVAYKYVWTQESKESSNKVWHHIKMKVRKIKGPLL